MERWGILPPGSEPDAEIDLGIEVSRIIGRGRDPVEGVLAFLEEQSVDLIVLATNHHGLDWLHRSVSEPVARKSGEMTLFVPAEAHGFISPAYGTVSLQNILIPVAEKPSSQPAIDGATRLVRQLQCEEGTFTLLHVGEDEPGEATPDVPGWKWRRLARKGNVIDVILETAGEKKADLIVMSTDGRNGFLDALRGSHSERVLRRAPCPVLVIPEHSHASTRIEKAANPDWYQERKRPPRR
jgi:nucleotide-binding universal stress UspA family protein